MSRRPREGNTKIMRRRRRALAEMYGWFCHYCEKPLVEPPEGKSVPMEKAAEYGLLYATLDHVVEMSRGGSSRLGNLVLSCVLCQQARHNERRDQDGQAQLEGPQEAAEVEVR